MSRGRPKIEQTDAKRQYIVEENGTRWHFDLDIFANGPILVENLDTTYNELERLFNKLEKLNEPEFHENGRKKRTTKERIGKIKRTEESYWKEHYKQFPDDRPKQRGRKSNK